MKKIFIFLLCLGILAPVEMFGIGGGVGGVRISPRISPRVSVRTPSVRVGSGVKMGGRNSSKIGNSGSRSIRSFSKSSTSKSISKFVGKPFVKARTIKTSSFSRRPVSITYTRPVRFHNPYLAYYLLSNRSYSLYRDSVGVRADTNAFLGFGKGRSGGGGSSAHFADSLMSHNSKDTLEITELAPINFLSDFAGIIPDTDEPRINSLIRRYKKATGVEIAVVTIPTLGDEIDLEEYAQILFDKWGVGERGVDNGILIIISSEDEILRIQPGYGMEELLPDATCREIEDAITIPKCKEKQWEPAVTVTTTNIIKRLGDKPVEMMKKELAERKKREHEEMMNTIYTTLEILAVLTFVAAFFFWIMNRKKRQYY